jgi:hypothetical protein
MPYQVITLASLRTLVFNRIQNPYFFGTQEKDDVVNETIRIYQLATGRWTDRYVISTVANRCIYQTSSITVTATAGTLPPTGIPQVLMPIRIAFNSDPLEPTSLSDMDNGFPGWQVQTTATGGSVSTVPLLWGPLGLNKFFIWPADAAGKNGLQIDAVKRAPVLRNDSDYVNLDTSEIPAFIGYSQHVLMFKRGGQNFAITQAGYNEFLRMLAQRNEMLKAESIYRAVMGEDPSFRTRPRRTSDATGRSGRLGVR